MLRRMAVADNHLPVLRADADDVAFDQSMVGGGNGRHATPVGVAAFFQAGTTRFTEAVLTEKIDHCSHVKRRQAGGNDMGGQVFALRHPQGSASFSFEPGSEAKMIRVKMGDDLAFQYPSRQRRLPGSFHSVERDAGIDRSKTVGVLQQPQVDVVECERQGHAQPKDTGSYRQGVARSRGGREGVVDLHCRPEKNLFNLDDLQNDSLAEKSPGMLQCSKIARPMKEPTYTITELARDFELTPRAIRYYEDQGLIAPQRAGVQRVYGKRDRTRLKLTLRGKRLGLSLAEIRELIDMYDTAPESTQLARLIEVLAERRARLEQQREDIEAVLSEIDAIENQCRNLLEAQKKDATVRKQS